MTITASIGVLLLTWILWDLYSGSVWLHREYHRSEEPFSYWLLIMLWLGVAISCFYW